MYQADKDTCTFCAGCSAVCPALAIVVYDNDIEMTPACINCGVCARFCPVSAIRHMEDHDRKNAFNRKNRL